MNQVCKLLLLITIKTFGETNSQEYSILERITNQSFHSTTLTMPSTTSKINGLLSQTEDSIIHSLTSAKTENTITTGPVLKNAQLDILETSSKKNVLKTLIYYNKTEESYQLY